MPDKDSFDVIIIGGSYAGLAAALTLGRSLRNVLVIDSEHPCNSHVPHAHNFITQDGIAPKQIAAIAKEQVSQYKTVAFHSGVAVTATKSDTGFEIATKNEELFHSRKLIIATGLKEIMPGIPGFAECWGITAIHCPYCHGYEARNEKTGILGNSDDTFELARLLSNWTKDLTVYTNGKSVLTPDETEKLSLHNIAIDEKEILRFEHVNGRIQHIEFSDSNKAPVTTIYAKLPVIQHSEVASQLGCDLTDHERIAVDSAQKTIVDGVFACGDCSNSSRDIALAVSSGLTAGCSCNGQMIVEDF